MAYAKNLPHQLLAVLCRTWESECDFECLPQTLVHLSSMSCSWKYQFRLGYQRSPWTLSKSPLGPVMVTRLHHLRASEWVLRQPVVAVSLFAEVIRWASLYKLWSFCTSLVIISVFWKLPLLPYPFKNRIAFSEILFIPSTIPTWLIFTILSRMRMTFCY